MAVHLNHTIVDAHDRVASARYLAELLGLPDPTAYGPFQVVQLDNDVSLDFVDWGEVSHTQHYAFLVSEQEFDEIFGRLQEQGIAFRSSPHDEGHGDINHNDGGRGVYWQDPNGHTLEIITRPYGSG